MLRLQKSFLNIESEDKQMEFFFHTIIGEVVFDLLVDAGEQAVKSSRIPKPIRFLIAAIGLLFFLAIIGIMVFAGVSISIEKSIIGGSIILAAAVLVIVAAFRKIHKARTHT